MSGDAYREAAFTVAWIAARKERDMTVVPHLERAAELLWQTGHPAIAEALQAEVEALIEKAERLERVLYPRVVEQEQKP